MKIAIVVHGRFHAFDLARELLRRGNEVTLFTNYPAWAVKRFGFPKEYVRSFWLHGVSSRLATWLHRNLRCAYPEVFLSMRFGRWAARQLARERWDVIHSWSGVSEETLRFTVGKGALRLLMRGSAHIRTQSRLLEEEQSRTGISLERPSHWIIEREEREYALADAVVVLSTFAHRTFIEEGVSREKLHLLPLGAELKAFRPSPEVVKVRCQRILAGEPLRILFVGAVSFQKGMWDMAHIVRALNRKRFRVRVIGSVVRETKRVLFELRGLAEFVPARPQGELPHWYAWGDVFIFPTIHDGYGMVLPQASAGALPILATTHCAGPDLIREGETGWILPPRSPEAFVERLLWCDAHREELSAMVRRIYEAYRPRDWADVARDFEVLCREKFTSHSNRAG